MTSPTSCGRYGIGLRCQIWSGAETQLTRESGQYATKNMRQMAKPPRTLNSQESQKHHTPIKILSWQAQSVHDLVPGGIGHHVIAPFNGTGAPTYPNCQDTRVVSRRQSLTCCVFTIDVHVMLLETILYAACSLSMLRVPAPSTGGIGDIDQKQHLAQQSRLK